MDIDMTKRNKVEFGIIICIIAVLLLFLFQRMYKLSIDNLNSVGASNLSEVSNYVNTYLIEDTDVISLTAKRVESMIKSGTDNSYIEAYLKKETAIIENTLDTGYTGLYGYINGEYLDGTDFVPDDDYVPTERPWYTAAMKANGKIAWVSPYLDVKTNSVMMSISILLEDKKSVLSVDIYLDDIQQNIKKIISTDNVNNMVLAGDGFVIASTNESQIGNNYATDQNLYGRIYESVSKGAGTGFVTVDESVSYVVYYERLNNNWYALSVVDESTLNRTLAIYIFVGLIALALIAASTYGILSRHIRRTQIIENTNRRLEAIANIYISLHIIDIVKDKVIEVHAVDYVKKYVDEAPIGAYNTLKYVLMKLTPDQSWDVILRFIDFDTLDERMQGKDTLTLEFLGLHGWTRGRFIVEKRVKGKIARLLWMVENIDDDKRKQDELQHLSEIDMLTGIRNRGSGENKIVDLMAKGKSGMFCLIDVDDFKSINDNYGHVAGDKVLIEIAAALQESFRDRDITLRLGGDEFAAFAVGVKDEATGSEIIERFFKAFANVEIPELKGHKVTLSAGAAFFDETRSESFTDIYKRADIGTYDAKKQDGFCVKFSYRDDELN